MLKQQAADIKAHIKALQFIQLLAHQQQGLLHGGVVLKIGANKHVLAHFGEHFLVDHIPHAVFLTAGGHIITVLNRGADSARIHQHFADDIRAHGRGVHHCFHPIHMHPHF